MGKVFLTADWKKLIVVNYAVEPELLLKYLPANTELDLWQGKCYLSLVGFMFFNTQVFGFRIPYHVNFEEVNLRFYVKHKNKDNEWVRGVVFIKEIVPKLAIAWMANLLYKEKYSCMKMRHKWSKFGDYSQHVSYNWKIKGKSNQFWVDAQMEPLSIEKGSEAEFILEHYWGFTRVNSKKTFAYQVKHPSWLCYPVRDYGIDVNFGRLYGETFGFLTKLTPTSYFLCQGSAVEVFKGNSI